LVRGAKMKEKGGRRAYRRGRRKREKGGGSEEEEEVFAISRIDVGCRLFAKKIDLREERIMPLEGFPHRRAHRKRRKRPTRK